MTKGQSLLLLQSQQDMRLTMISNRNPSSLMQSKNGMMVEVNYDDQNLDEEEKKLVQETEEQEGILNLQLQQIFDERLQYKLTVRCDDERACKNY